MDLKKIRWGGVDEITWLRLRGLRSLVNMVMNLRVL
jgi:hypothetical protein